MVFGGRATFYISLLCLFGMSFFNTLTAHISGVALNRASLYTPTLGSTPSYNWPVQLRDTTYYKNIVDTTTSNGLRIMALDSLIAKTLHTDKKSYVIYTEQYIEETLKMKRYDDALKMVNTYAFHVSSRMNNPEKAAAMVHRFTPYLNKVSDSSLLMDLWYEKAFINKSLGKFKRAEEGFTKIYTSSIIKDSTRIMDALHQRSIIHSLMGNKMQALKDLTRAQKYFDRVNDLENSLYTQENLITLYGEFGLDQKSIEELEKLIAKKVKHGKTEFLCYDYSNLHISYRALKDIANAEKYLIKTIALGKEEIKNNPRIELNIFYWLAADFYTKEDRLVEAKKYLDLFKSELLKKNIDPNSFDDYRYALSYYYLKSGQIKASEKIALDLYKHIESIEIENKISLYELLYMIYDHKKDYQKSLRYYGILNRLKDSVYGDKKANSLSYYQTLYETEKKEKEIANQELNLQSQRRVISTQERQQIYFLIGLIVLAIVLIGSFFFIKKIRTEQKKVATSLLEKELLLKEIHHRVKNNLQIVYGLIYKQGRISKDHTFKSLMNDAQGRIKSMAMIHQKLYQNNNFSQVDMKAYISELIKDINASFRTANSHVHVTLKITKTRLHMDIAIPLGLILNELITNTYKHAFNDGQGNVLVSIEKVNDQHRIRVKDDGVGLPEGMDLKKSTSLGMHLIMGLCHQIRATFNYKNNNGSEFTILLHPNS